MPRCAGATGGQNGTPSLSSLNMSPRCSTMMLKWSSRAPSWRCWQHPHWRRQACRSQGRKTMLIVFFDHRGITHELVLESNTVNQAPLQRSPGTQISPLFAGTRRDISGSPRAGRYITKTRCLQCQAVLDREAGRNARAPFMITRSPSLRLLAFTQDEEAVKGIEFESVAGIPIRGPEFLIISFEAWLLTRQQRIRKYARFRRSTSRAIPDKFQYVWIWK